MSDRSPSVSTTAVARRTVLAGLGAVGLTPACAQSRGGALYASQAASLDVAMKLWAQTGGTLVIDRDFAVASPITVVARPGLTYRLTTDGPRTLRYAGERFHWALCLYSEGGTPFTIDGALTIDGANRVSMPLFVRFENVGGAARRDFSVDGLTCRNARMAQGRSRIDGSPTNSYGASGMAFSGGFDRLALRNVRAESVTRARGAGRAGSQGCVGIAVSGSLDDTRSAKHVLIEDFVVDTVDSDDPPASSERGDMDGVLVFQAPERTGTRPVIQRGLIRNAAGRAIKVFAPGGGGTTRDLRIERSVPGSRANGSIDIAHQHGDGLIENIEIVYSGQANASPTTVIGMSSGTRRSPGFPFAPGEIRNVRITDTTGMPKRALIGVQYNVAGDPAPRRYVVSGLSDSGSAHYLMLPGALGTGARADIDLSGLEVNLIDGLIASEDRAPLLALKARRVNLRGSRRVPAKVLYDNRPAPVGLRLRVDADATVRGLEPG